MRCTISETTALARHPAETGKARTSLERSLVKANVSPLPPFRWGYSWSVGFEGPKPFSVCLWATAGRRERTAPLGDFTREEAHAAFPEIAACEPVVATRENTAHAASFQTVSPGGTSTILVTGGYFRGKTRDAFLMGVEEGEPKASDVGFLYCIAGTRAIWQGGFTPIARDRYDATAPGMSFKVGSRTLVRMTDADVRAIVAAAPAVLQHALF